MEIDKTSSVHKETAWKIKLDKNVMLILNAVEDSSLPEPSVSVILSEGDRKVSFTMTKDKFLNLTGVLDSFSQVCLGVEPVLAQEDYAVKEPKSQENKAEKVEPPAKKVDEPQPAPPAKKVDEPQPAPPAKKVDEPRPAPPAPAPVKQPEPAPATTAESRMLAKLEGSKSSPPPKVAFPPRFPSTKVEEEDEPEEAEEAEEDKAREEALKDISELDFGSSEPEPTPTLAPARAPFAPPAKPAPPAIPTKVSTVPSPPPAPASKPHKDEEEEEAAPEWDPW